MLDNITWDEWIEYGISQGYCSEQFCYTHSTPPMTEVEEQIIYKNDSDLDVLCLHMVRLGSPKDWDIDAMNVLGEEDE